jgi:hypothetical protein
MILMIWAAPEKSRCSHGAGKNASGPVDAVGRPAGGRASRVFLFFEIRRETALFRRAFRVGRPTLTCHVLPHRAVNPIGPAAPYAESPFAVQGSSKTTPLTAKTGELEPDPTQVPTALPRPS